MKTRGAIGCLKRGWAAFWVEIAWLVASGCGGQTQAAADASAAPQAVVEGGLVRETAGSCPIDTSAYDHSCNVDSDCVSTAMGLPVRSGDYCRPSSCDCPTDAINRKAVEAYAHDVLQTPLGSGALPHAPCNCALLGSCCVAGHCSTACVTDDGDAGAGPAQDGEVPNPAYFPEGGVLCSSLTGPIDAAASLDAAVYACGYPQQCIPLNGGWACCMVVSSQRMFCQQVPIN